MNADDTGSYAPFMVLPFRFPDVGDDARLRRFAPLPTPPSSQFGVHFISIIPTHPRLARTSSTRTCCSLKFHPRQYLFFSVSLCLRDRCFAVWQNPAKLSRSSAIPITRCPDHQITRSL